MEKGTKVRVLRSAPFHGGREGYFSFYAGNHGIVVLCANPPGRNTAIYGDLFFAVSSSKIYPICTGR